MLTITVGNKAPFFEGIDQNGNNLSLNDFKGQKLIIYFYPKDNTPGCTAEACNLRDNYTDIIKQGFQIVGVSADNEKSHKNFSDKYKLPFPLIADTDKIIIKAFGVWGNKKFMGREFEGIIRTTFIIDENGIIEKIITKVDTKNHTNQIIN